MWSFTVWGMLWKLTYYYTWRGAVLAARLLGGGGKSPSVKDLPVLMAITAYLTYPKTQVRISFLQLLSCLNAVGLGEQKLCSWLSQGLWTYLPRWYESQWSWQRPHLFSSPSLWHPCHLWPVHPICHSSPIHLLWQDLPDISLPVHSATSFSLLPLTLHLCLLCSCCQGREKGASSQEEVLVIITCTDNEVVPGMCSLAETERTRQCKSWASSLLPAIDMPMILWIASTIFWKIGKWFH